MVKIVLPAFTRHLLVRIVAAACTPVIVVGSLMVIIPRLTDLPSGAAFRVDGAIVTVDQLQHRMKVLKALYGITPPTDPVGQDRFRRESAEAVAVSMVIDKAARDEHVAVSGKDGREALGQLVANFPDGINGFARLLGTVGATENDVVDELARQQSTRQLYDKVVAGQGAAGVVTPEQAHQYYDQHRAQFVQPELRHLRNIVLERQDDANQVATQAKGGADFAALAAQYSLDQSTSSHGGDLGFVARDQLEPEFAGPAFGSSPTAVFGPVRTKDGWDVGQVLEVRPATGQSFEQVSKSLTDWLTAQRAVARWRSWLSARLTAADVRYVDAYRPANPGAGLAPVPAASAEPRSASQRR